MGLPVSLLGRAVNRSRTDNMSQSDWDNDELLSLLCKLLALGGSCLFSLNGTLLSPRPLSLHLTP